MWSANIAKEFSSHKKFEERFMQILKNNLYSKDEDIRTFNPNSNLICEGSFFSKTVDMAQVR